MRLAVNLGFTFDPFLGGLIIALISYRGLFWIDGLTCIIAILIFRKVLKNKSIKSKEDNKFIEMIPTSVFNDKPFLVFLTAVFIMGLMFFQLFTTLPLFYRDIHGLSELQIGMLIALNGLLIFIFEMPLMHRLERVTIDRLQLIKYSFFLFSFSFLLLTSTSWIGILIISMMVISMAEMFGFPFTNSFAISRAPKGKEGKFMALYTMAFSFAHIFSAKIGLFMTDLWGFNANWLLMGLLGFIAALLIVWLKKMTTAEKVVNAI